jgi:Reverse transcriptase (RNA-dependent DNA polymerase)/RNase H-like domain found in reverse transcriptase
MVVDGHQPFENMVKDVTPLPDQDIIHLEVMRAKICPKIDLSNMYEQICIVPEDVHKTVFVTIFGMFMSNIMQQGDCNTPSMFQHSMNITFWEFIGIFLHVYLDDLFIYSNTVEEHQQHLKTIFMWLCKCRFYMREDKCELFAKRIDCLGHVIDNKGLHADADKMAKICCWNRLHNYNNVQRFLGFIQYLAHFLPDVTTYMGPLATMTKNGTLFDWRPWHETCFQMIKLICCQTPILCLIESSKDEPIWVICDTSVYRVGAIYGQGPTWQTCRPAGFMSKKFTNAQWNYHVFKHEMLTILEVLLKWEDKLQGYHIHMVTSLLLTSDSRGIYTKFNPSTLLLLSC